VLDRDGLVFDGRNRVAACQLLDRVPLNVQVYDGDDPEGFALSVNLARRNLTTGARAIIAARAARMKGATGKESAEIANLQSSRVANANVILDYAPDLADAVVSGAERLSVALREARERKADKDSTEVRMTALRDKRQGESGRLGPSRHPTSRTAWTALRGPATVESPMSMCSTNRNPLALVSPPA
jgi:hypothetical protein